MEETSESAHVTETEKTANPRVEIDTSPPFESVKEAVDRSGGSGPWIQNRMLRLAADHHGSEEFNVNRVEEEAEQLEKDLMIKERETIDVLIQLEAAKRFVQALKLKLIVPEFSSFFASPDLNLASYVNYSNENLSMSPQKSSGSMLFGLDRAKLNLSKTSIDLCLIQQSVESLNKTMRKDKTHVPDSVENCTNAGMEVRRVDFETEQFKKVTEASRYEVMKAMAEIERTKNSIKMAEMRLNAAKKMEEAAKAIEAIAIYEQNIESSADVLEQSNGISLSCEEHRLLARKAQQVDPDICKSKFIDSNTIPSKNGGDHKFKNSRNSGHRYTHVRDENGSNGATTTTTTSMADILGRRVMLQDKVIVGNHVATNVGRDHASLSQMLREQSRLILHPGESRGGLDVGKSPYIVQRKKFGFIQVPLSIKRTKKKTQPSLNAIVSEEDGMESIAHRFLSAAVKLDRKPSKCVVFEDDPRGITAAHNCTMMDVALIGAHPAYDLGQADLAVGSFNELSVINLRRLFAHIGSTFMDLQKQTI